jgi:alpha-tubulin suppressor-like RCC1 family protein
VSELDDAVGVSVGGGYACAVTAKKTVKCWGHNYAGTLGIGTNSGPETCTVAESTTACATTPRRVTTLSDVNAVAAGFNHACASRGSGKILCWGTNSFGELGIGGTGGAEQCHVNIYTNDTDGCSTTPVKVVVDSHGGDGGQSGSNDPQ